MADSVTFAGQIETKRCEIINYKGNTIDISNLVIEFNLFEDMFANSLSGNLVIVDTVDLITTIPLSGEELLDVEFITPSLTTGYKHRFYVYKLSDRKIEGDRKQVYVLHFTSLETIVNVNKKISKSFKGLLSSTVDRVFRDSTLLGSKKTLLVEPCENNYNFISAYWSPFQTLNFCAQRAVSKNAANYFFYETNQSYEFVSVNKLVSQPTTRDYVFSNADGDTVAKGDFDKKSSLVKTMYADVQYDYIRRVTMGMYASKLTTFDVTTKSINTQTFDYLDSFSSFNHLDKNPIASDSLVRSRLANQYFLEKNSYSVEGGQQYNKYLLNRNSLTEQIFAFKFNIEVPGRTDIKVGQTISFTINNFKQIGNQDKNEIVDDIYTGKYLITAIRHKIQGNTHTMYLEIVKDSFATKLQPPK
jgi:hypothetical protein